MLLPNKIQDEEDIGPFGRQPSVSGDADGSGQYVDSHGNRVNVGNFDANGLNVNNNWDDNRHGSIGVASARKSPPLSDRMPRLTRGIHFSGLDPAAEHPADLVYQPFERNVFLIVDCFNFFHEPEKHTQKVQLQTDFFEYRQFFRFMRLTRK